MLANVGVTHNILLYNGMVEMADSADDDMPTCYGLCVVKFICLTWQDKALQTVIRVLLSFKSSDIEGAVQTLDQNRLDTLMKYIYRGFEYPSEGSSAQLLTWHERVQCVIFYNKCVHVFYNYLVFILCDCGIFYR